MKRTHGKKKLGLSKETIRQLQGADLKGAAGGFVSGDSGCAACPTTPCTREVTNACATQGCATGNCVSGGCGSYVP